MRYNPSALPNLDVVAVKKLLGFLVRGGVIRQIVFGRRHTNVAVFIDGVEAIFWHDAAPILYRRERDSVSQSPGA